MMYAVFLAGSNQIHFRAQNIPKSENVISVWRLFPMAVYTLQHFHRFKNNIILNGYKKEKFNTIVCLEKS